ncbi:MAG TPA: metal-sensing transcriptional repressor [Treponemataceae bacterium]|jgi:DNA-binding FrmR family transcriptional regulator|nr:metal-sensing transcriptional repressor [Treponemataceae bacterium]
MKADRDKTLRLLKTARGQLDGIVGMIEDDRYCVDISNQLLATIAILRKANAGILRAHLGHCVTESLRTGTETDRQKKIDELMGILEKTTGA